MFSKLIFTGIVAVSERRQRFTGPLRRSSQAAGSLTLDMKQPFDPRADLAYSDTNPYSWLSRWIQKISETGCLNAPVAHR